MKYKILNLMFSSILVISLFIISLIYFVEKDKIIINYEKELPFNINQNEIIDNGFHIKLNNIDISYKGIDVASIKKIDIFIYFYINYVNIENISIKKEFKNIFPYEISKVELNNNIFKPYYINIIYDDKYGKIKGEVDVSNNKINLKIEPSSKFKEKTILNNLKKENGVYFYEYSY